MWSIQVIFLLLSFLRTFKCQRSLLENGTAVRIGSLSSPVSGKVSSVRFSILQKIRNLENDATNNKFVTDSIMKKLTDVTEELQALKTRNLILEDRNEMLNEKLKSLEIHKNLSLENISNLEKENAEFKTELKALLQTVSDKETLIMKTVRRINDTNVLFHKRQSLAFQRKKDTMAFENKEMKEQLNVLNETLATLNFTYENLAGDFHQLKEKVDVCYLKYDRLSRTVNTSLLKLNEMNESLVRYKQIDDLNTRFQMVEDNLRSITISFNETLDIIRKDQVAHEERQLNITSDTFSEDTASDCLELRNKGYSTGVYSIHPWGVNNRSIRVLCDMETEGGGWTVFQKRVDGSISFARNWTEYQNGFGNVETEHWLGNEAIHALTLNASSLYVKLQKKTGERFSQYYTDFFVADQSDDYRLHIGSVSNRPGAYNVTKCSGLTSFLCKNGKCISIQKQCNNMDDCGDGSDETDCAEDEVLVFAQRQYLNLMSLSNFSNHVVPAEGINNAIAIDLDPVEKQIYWTDVNQHRISKIYLNGSGQQIVIDGVPHADGIALDIVNRKLYWTDTGNDKIEMSDLDGGQRRAIVTDGLTEPRDIAVDSKNKKLYWSDWGANAKIEKANLDGSERVVLVNTSIGWPNGIALDAESGILYWGDAQLQLIEMVNTDGSNRRIFLSGNIHVFGLSLLGKYLYWSDWRRNLIARGNKDITSAGETLLTPILTPIDLKAVIIKKKKRIYMTPCHNERTFKTPDHIDEEFESFFQNFTEGGWWLGNCHSSYLNGVYGSPQWRNIWLPNITSGADFLLSQMMVRRHILQ